VNNVSLLPRIKIHVWGGLGSQLHAWYLAEALMVKHPGRKIKLVFHSSGVTRRTPEICQVLAEFKYIFVDDFKENTNNIHDSDSGFNLQNLFRRIAKTLLDPILINSRFNAKLSDSRLKP